jgi:hypothetical protein
VVYHKTQHKGGWESDGTRLKRKEMLMDNIVSSLQLGWRALLFKEDAYEEMRASASPVLRGLVLIVVVGLVVALLAFVGDVLEWAGMPDLGAIQETVFGYMTQMPFMQENLQANPEFAKMFKQQYDMSWAIVQAFMPSPVGAAMGIVLTPLGLVVRWLIYGLLAYLFARWLGGTATLSETLGVLALAVAPMVIYVLTLVPYVQVGNLVSVWSLLCAYYGLKTAHKLSWSRAVWATLLPFILGAVLLILLGCLGGAFLGLALGGQS